MYAYHLLLDECEEDRLGRRKFGSTKAGIAPFYADKCYKTGVQVCDLFDEGRLRSRLEAALAGKNVLLRHLYSRPAVSVEELAPRLLAEGQRIRPFVCDTTALLHDALRSGKRILLEGQLGALRDPDHGICPFTTSSFPLAGFAAVGAGIPPYAIERIVAVVKAYSTCVGAGPFVSEIFGEEAHELRERGGDAGEYGATTGRPRRVGWFDAVATRYGRRLQGATEAALSLLDVLGYLDPIPMCVAYEVHGGQTEIFPVPAQLEGATPVFEGMPGWKCDISQVRNYEEMPARARNYVQRVEDLIGVPIRWASVGSRREAMIRR